MQYSPTANHCDASQDLTAAVFTAFITSHRGCHQRTAGIGKGTLKSTSRNMHLRRVQTYQQGLSFWWYGAITPGTTQET